MKILTRCGWSRCARQIRRTEGVNPPTARQGRDGEWQPYVSLGRTPEGGLSIYWGGTRYTWTSPVVDVEADEQTTPQEPPC